MAAYIRDGGEGRWVALGLWSDFRRRVLELEIGLSKSEALECLPNPLTEREREVLELILNGLYNKAIASQLEIGIGTVRAHVQHVIEKLGLHSKFEVAAIRDWSKIPVLSGRRVSRLQTA